MPEPLSHIKHALHQVQHSQHALQGQAWTHLRSEAADLAAMDDVAAADALSSWLLKYPDALRLLLRAAASTPGTVLAISRTSAAKSPARRTGPALISISTGVLLAAPIQVWCTSSCPQPSSAP